MDVAFLASAGWGDLNLFKVDMAKAYKQAPVHPDDRHELVIGVRDPDGKVCYFIHNSLPFGASAAPFQFARLAHAVVSVASGIFRLPIQKYLDDFGAVVPGEIADEASKTFCFLFELLGFRLKERKKLQLNLLPKFSDSRLGTFRIMAMRLSFSLLLKSIQE